MQSVTRDPRGAATVIHLGPQGPQPPVYGGLVGHEVSKISRREESTAMNTRPTLRAALPAALALCLVALPAAAVPQDVAEVTTGPTQLEWTPNHGYAGFRLVVSGPDGVVERTFDGGDRPLFSLAELAVASDGPYKWELTATPDLPPAAIASLRTEAEAGDRGVADRRTVTDLPTVMSGFFRVLNGSIVQPGEVEQPARLAPERAGAGGTGSATAPLSRATAADQVIPDDLIVQQSLCVGFDCVNGEAFGFDTIRLKENNTRIKFEDTSVGSFPTQDWQLTANDSNSGGNNKFTIDAISPIASVPFTIEDGAGTNALYVDDGGNVGFGTSVPVLDLHIATGNTPGIRLEQNTSSGFTAQTWDIAGNEANFFVRDVTGGSTLPFRIRPGAPTSSIDIDADGNVGFGTASPDDKVDVESGNVRVTGGDVTVREDDDGNNAAVLSASATRGTLELLASGGITTALNRQGGISFMENNLGLAGCQDPDHDLTIGGTGAGCNTGTFSEIDAGEVQFDISSSRSIKQNLVPVEVENILEKIDGVDVYTYDFIDGKTDRIGLMAEDFHQIFGRGSDKMLSGHEVQLALWLAVQELKLKNDVLSEQNDELREAIEDLRRELTE